MPLTFKPYSDKRLSPFFEGLVPEEVVIIEYLRLGCCHKLESLHFPASILVFGRVMLADENLPSFNNGERKQKQTRSFSKQERNLPLQYTSISI
jgi:hypothetical protein